MESEYLMHLNDVKRKSFNKAGLDVEVKKDNPTLLYYPESLEKDLWKKKE